VNGIPQDKFCLTRGIRQGGPLSPYLFRLCAGLSSLLRKADFNGTISGIPVVAGGTRITHLFFAYDNLVFCRANFNEWCSILCAPQ